MVEEGVGVRVAVGIKAPVGVGVQIGVFVGVSISVGLGVIVIVETTMGVGVSIMLDINAFFRQISKSRRLTLPSSLKSAVSGAGQPLTNLAPVRKSDFQIL